MPSPIAHCPSGFTRRVSLLDNYLSEVSRTLQVLGGDVNAGRPNPAARLTQEAPLLTDQQRRHAAGLMRVNHVGEICAQALYRGQAFFCRDAAIQAVFLQAAVEEVDHLVWCNDRLLELGSRPSLLNPLWYLASFSLGVVASRSGKEINLGFMAETERQVEHHLNHHLLELPPEDTRSRAIVTQMRDDEINHRTTAEHHGAAALPSLIKLAMKAMSKVMTTTAYRL